MIGGGRIDNMDEKGHALEAIKLLNEVIHHLRLAKEKADDVECASEAYGLAWYCRLSLRGSYES